MSINAKIVESVDEKLAAAEFLREEVARLLGHIDQLEDQAKEEIVARYGEDLGQQKFRFDLLAFKHTWAEFQASAASETARALSRAIVRQEVEIEDIAPAAPAVEARVEEERPEPYFGVDIKGDKNAEEAVVIMAQGAAAGEARDEEAMRAFKALNRNKGAGYWRSRLFIAAYASAGRTSAPPPAAAPVRAPAPVPASAPVAAQPGQRSAPLPGVLRPAAAVASAKPATHVPRPPATPQAPPATGLAQEAPAVSGQSVEPHPSAASQAAPVAAPRPIGAPSYARPGLARAGGSASQAAALARAPEPEVEADEDDRDQEVFGDDDVNDDRDAPYRASAQDADDDVDPEDPFQVPGRGIDPSDPWLRPYESKAPGEDYDSVPARGLHLQSPEARAGATVASEPAGPAQDPVERPPAPVRTSMITPPRRLIATKEPQIRRDYGTGANALAVDDEKTQRVLGLFAQKTAGSR